MMKPRNYKRDPRAPLFSYRSEPRHSRIDGGLVTQRVIGPSVGWRNNHFLPFAPNWDDISNDIDPKVAKQIRSRVQAEQKKKEDLKKAKKPPLAADVRRRVADMILSHEKKFAEAQASNAAYPILHVGEYPGGKAPPKPIDKPYNSANAMYNNQMRLVHQNAAPGRARR